MGAPKIQRRPRLTVKDLAYAAGFFDGEGCVLFVALYKDGVRTHGGSLRAKISNTNHPIIKWFHETWGGTVEPPRKDLRDGGIRRTVWTWGVNGDNAERFLLDILPFLREKTPQAKLAMAIRRLPPDEREEYVVELKALKRVDYTQ